jgi:hypothetical protein
MNTSKNAGLVWLVCFLIGLLIFAIGGVFSFYVLCLIGFLIVGLGFGFLLGIAYTEENHFSKS